MTPLQVCRLILERRIADSTVREFFSSLPDEERHYWIASLYALLMPKARRRKLAAYFTPPHLVRHALDLLVACGIKPGESRILDPASGGAAFLVPLAAKIATEHRRLGVDSKKTLQTIEKTLAGVEIAPDLVALSRMLLSDLLRPELAKAKRGIDLPILTADTLAIDDSKTLYDAVIGNPPYGRLFRPSKKLQRRFSEIIAGGYVNLYALFIEQSIRWTKPGGLICLVVPMSFVGGPNFSALRKRVLATADVLYLDPIDKRRDVFLDVLYDVCVLVLRKHGGDQATTRGVSRLLQVGHEPILLGNLDLPAKGQDRVWALANGSQDDCLFQDGMATIQDYGYITKTGYFVWNREQERYRAGFKPKTTEVPLLWAHNIRANEHCLPRDGGPDNTRIGFVKISEGNPAVVTTDALILQRTSNRRQKRRLTAAVVRQRGIVGGRGFVSENHTILVLPDPAKKQLVALGTLCRLLNTAAVDARFRRMSGSVSVSTKALRVLPVPLPQAVRACFGLGISDDEAAEAAYSRTDSGRQPPSPSNA